jgi:RNA polymerase sigma-70 factor, ECF subfamily
MSHCPLNAGNGQHATTTAMSNDAREASPLTLRPDESLALEYAETGNQRAFEELVHRYEREIYSYLRHRLGDSHLAEDAFQTTFLQLHLKCHQFEPNRRLRPWLYTIANNQATDLLRRNRRHRATSLSNAAGWIGSSDQRESLGGRLEAIEASPMERLESAEDCQNTRLALDTIPAKLKQLLDLIAYQGLKYSEAANVLGIPLGTVKSRMSKALRSLREALETTGFAASNEISSPLLLGKTRF